MQQEDKYNQNLKKQVSMNTETWETLQHKGVTEDTEVQLDFFYDSPSKEKAEQLQELLNEYDYEVLIAQSGSFLKRRWLVSGKTSKTTISLQILDQWVHWMITAGKQHDSDFDGWGVEV